MENKITMKGMDVQYISLIHESVSVCDAIKEFVDNAIDAKAKNIELSYEDGLLEVSDDAPMGMVNNLEIFAHNYKSHISNSRNTIGIKGVGAKDAMLRLADFFKKGSLITIITSDGKKAKKLTWNLCERSNSINSVYIEDLEEPVNCGTHIIITNPCNVDNRVISKVRKSLSYTYSYKMKFEGVKIKIKGGANDSISEIEPMDFFYLDKLFGENGEHLNRMEENGNYECDGFFFIVRQNKFKKNGCKDSINIPTINIFISDAAERKDYDDGADAFDDAKFGALFNGRFISKESTSEQNEFSRALNRGGAWRCRTVVFVKDDTYELLSGKSNKSNGIIPLKSNQLLKDYTISLDPDICNNIKKMYRVDDKKTEKSRYMNAYEALETQYLWLSRINTKRTSKEAITLDVVNDVCSGKNAVSINTSDLEKHFDLLECAEFKELSDEGKKWVLIFEKVFKNNKIGEDRQEKILLSAIEEHKNA